MFKKNKMLFVVLSVLFLYFIIFFIGFKAGSVYSRMQNKFEIETIEIPVTPPPDPCFFVIDRTDYGRKVNFSAAYCNSQDVYIRLYKNEKLRNLLKVFDMEIYSEDGKKLYDTKD